MSRDKSSMIPTRFRGLRVLLIDNDAESLFNMATKLEDCSYKVTTSEVATVALSILEESADRIDLVMVDANLPEMDSLNFINKVQRIKEFPVILMSAELQEDMVEQAMAKGVCFVLKKPVSFKSLQNVWQHVYRKNKDKNIRHGQAEDIVGRNEDQETDKDEVIVNKSDVIAGSKQDEDNGRADDNMSTGAIESCIKRALSQKDGEAVRFKKRRIDGKGKEVLPASSIVRNPEVDFPASLLKLLQQTDARKAPDFLEGSPVLSTFPTRTRMWNVNSMSCSYNQEQLLARMKKSEERQEGYKYNGGQYSVEESRKKSCL